MLVYFHLRHPHRAADPDSNPGIGENFSIKYNIYYVNESLKPNSH